MTRYKIWLHPGFLLLYGVILYFFSRLINLTIIPVFVDEAIYTHWSQIIRSDPSNSFIPLSDGKQPLFMWIASNLFRFPIDPLIATRLVSVVAGFMGMVGVWFLVRELLDKKIAYIAAGLFIFCPFLMLYNRLAVPDGLLTTFFIFTILFLLLVAKTQRLDYALLLGWIIGGGMLTKSTAAIFLFFIPLSLLFYDWKKNNWQSLFKLVGLWIVALFSGLLLYSILRLSPLYYLIAQRTPDFIFTPSEIMQHPFDIFWGRIPTVVDWLTGYLTIPIILSVVVGAFFLIKKNWRVGWFILIWFLGPLMIEMEIAKGFTPRYFIFVAPIALIFAAYLFSIILQKANWVRILVAAALIFPALLFEFFLLTNPEQAPIPQKEKDGYLEQWSAGYGITEISDFIRQQAELGRPITVGTEGTQGYGTLPDGLQIYLRDLSNVAVVGLGQRADIYTVPKDLITDSQHHPAFLVVNDNRMHDKQNSHLKLLAEYPKANGLDPLLLYQIEP